MALSIQFTPATVKQLGTRWQQALALGDTRLVRRITVLLALGQRQPLATVSTTFGVSEATLYRWLAAFLVDGLGSLVYRRPPGRPAKLSGTQKTRLRTLLLAGPEAAGYPSAAWNAPLVQDLIQREFGVLYNGHYVSELLHNLGFSYQKARFVSDHLNDATRRHWLQQEWPRIVAQAQERGAALLFGDEASFAQWGSLGYTWAPRGQQPVVKTTGRRKGYKVWGLLEWFSGRVLYRGQEGRFTAKSYIAFLEWALWQIPGEIILVQDGARYHTAKETQAWIAAQAGRVTVYQLPSYSPDYNPIEHVWRYVKEGTHNAYFATFAALVARVEERLGRLQAKPERVQQLMGTPLDEFIGAELPAAWNERERPAAA